MAMLRQMKGEPEEEKKEEEEEEKVEEVEEFEDPITPGNNIFLVVELETDGFMPVCS